MSNFTKSIFYSGAVLAVAMIAVFSIYTNMTQTGGDISSIEPAAGEEAVLTDGAIDQAGEYISNTATDAAEAAKGIAEQAMENAERLSQETEEATDDAVAAAEDAAEEATQETAAEENATPEDATAENTAEEETSEEAIEPAAGK